MVLLFCFVFFKPRFWYNHLNDLLPHSLKESKGIPGNFLFLHPIPTVFRNVSYRTMDVNKTPFIACNLILIAFLYLNSLNFINCSFSIYNCKLPIKFLDKIIHSFEVKKQEIPSEEFSGGRSASILPSSPVSPSGIG